MSDMSLEIIPADPYKNPQLQKEKGLKDESGKFPNEALYYTMGYLAGIEGKTSKSCPVSPDKRMYQIWVDGNNAWWFEYKHAKLNAELANKKPNKTFDVKEIRKEKPAFSD